LPNFLKTGFPYATIGKTMNAACCVVNLKKYSGKFKLFRSKRSFDLDRFVKKPGIIIPINLPG
jgi:hypothetical protein